jgi:hypothetical protein
MSPEFVLCASVTLASDAHRRTIRIIVNHLSLVILPPGNVPTKNVCSHGFNVRYDGVLRIGDDALDAHVDVGSMRERSSSFAGSVTRLPRNRSDSYFRLRIVLYSHFRGHAFNRALFSG